LAKEEAVFYPGGNGKETGFWFDFSRIIDVL